MVSVRFIADALKGTRQRAAPWLGANLLKSSDVSMPIDGRDGPQRRAV
jgi:hypothetical protein